MNVAYGTMWEDLHILLAGVSLNRSTIIDFPMCITQIHEGWQAQSEGSLISEIDMTLMAPIATNDTVDS
jgi:hypothetical protein